jgi:hypothetical protein
LVDAASNSRSDLRKKVYLVIERLDKYAGCVSDYLDQMKTIGDVIIRAQKVAECMVADDLFEAWSKLKKEEEPVYF